MAKFDLNDLGITQEELRQRIVDKVATDLMSDECFESDLERRVSKMLKEKVDSAVAELGDRVVGPRIAEMLEDLCLQQTNMWGEKTGKTLTFTEYLVSRAEGYMAEALDGQGRTQAECRSRGAAFTASGTRVARMVDEHLDYSIKAAMTKALQSANSQIAEGIAETVKAQLAAILARIQKTGKVA